MTGRTYTSFRTQQKKQRPFRILKIGLTRDREELYERINRRVDQMMGLPALIVSISAGSSSIVRIT